MKENVCMFLLIFMLSSVIIENVFASTVTPSNDHELILQILNDRKEKFSTYAQLLEDASCIFSMKTKFDIKRRLKKYLWE